MNTDQQLELCRAYLKTCAAADGRSKGLEKPDGPLVTISRAAGSRGSAIAGLLVAFPTAFVAALAGLALLGTIGAALATAVKDEAEREPALITFLVTLSGVTLAGLGSAFWGLLAGVLALALRRSLRPAS